MRTVPYEVFSNHQKLLSYHGLFAALAFETGTHPPTRSNHAARTKPPMSTARRSSPCAGLTRSGKSGTESAKPPDGRTESVFASFDAGRATSRRTARSSTGGTAGWSPLLQAESHRSLLPTDRVRSKRIECDLQPEPINVPKPWSTSSRWLRVSFTRPHPNWMCLTGRPHPRGGSLMCASINCRHLTATPRATRTTVFGYV